MKRDLDLARQLLADIESHGAECAVSTLRPGVATEADEQVRYHVRLLIDAGLVKETDRSTGGVPCVRLTNAGHEFLELAHSEPRWREAKWVVRERTGGMSLTVIKTVLTKWAAETATRGYRPYRAAYRPYAYRPAPPIAEPRYAEPRYVERTAYSRANDRDWLSTPGEEPRLVRTRPDYLERFDWRDTFDWREEADRERYARETYPRDAYRYDTSRYDWDADEYGVSLPIQVV
ncbi:MAG: DUF2513 domain-containing protein [Planctomycetota bacterium]